MGTVRALQCRSVAAALRGRSQVPGNETVVVVVVHLDPNRPGARRVTERTVVPAETHVEQGPLDRQEILDLIRDRLADILEIEPSSINEGDSFADDLEADSLALIELVEALEEELGERSVGFRIEDEDLEDLKTVRDAVDYVAAKMG